MTQTIVIAIDGPAGAGKSSVAKAVAERLGLARLDTGAMYRAIAWAAGRLGIDPSNGPDLAALAARTDLRLGPDGIVVDGEPREQQIRNPAVSATVSAVSSHPEVRRIMVAKQQDLAKAGGVVIEGRDIGSVVAPWAEVKVFLTASPGERARRRLEDLASDGHDIGLDRLQKDIDARDAADSRTTPLVPAPGAVTIDSTGKTLDQVVDEIARLAQSAARPGPTP